MGATRSRGWWAGPRLAEALAAGLPGRQPWRRPTGCRCRSAGPLFRRLLRGRRRPARSTLGSARGALVLSLVLLSFLAAAEPEAAGTQAPPLTLQTFLREVSERAPQLRTQQEAEVVARARIGVEGAWEDPSVEVMAESVPLRGGPEQPMPMYTYRFTQPLGTLWRRGPAKSAARAQLGAEQARTRRVDWDARAMAVQAFWDLWMNQEMQALIGRQVATLERMRASARARYVAGMMMGHHDVLRAEAEIATMQAEAAGLESERGAAVALINTLRGRPPDAPVGAAMLAERTPLLALPPLLSRAPERPELAEMRAMRAEMQARRTLAHRMYLPMPMVSGFFEQRPGMEPNSVGGIVGFSVPLWWFDRQRNEVRMAEGMVRQSERALEAMDAMTRADLQMAWSRARGADAALVALEATALPRLRETVRSAEAAYTSGSGDFLSLLEATMAFQRLEAQHVQAVVRRELTLFELERLLGASLSTPQSPSEVRP